MSRAPVFPMEDKIRIVLSILAGERSRSPRRPGGRRSRSSRLARGSGSSWRPGGWGWRRAGRRGLPAGKSSPPPRSTT